MKLGLISDLHATLPALDAVLAALDAAGVDRVVCLGDVVDLGPQPNEVVDRLLERGIPCIRGNHDRLDEHPTLPMLAEVEAWTRARLTPDRAAWLAGLPEQRVELLGPCRVWCVHGSPASITEGLTADLAPDRVATWAEQVDFDALVCGHTHVAFARRDGRRTVVNVGSVAQPFERAFAVPPRLLPFCDFAVLTAGPAGVDAQLRRIPQPLDEVRRAYVEAGFPYLDRWLATWSG